MAGLAMDVSRSGAHGLDTTDARDLEVLNFFQVGNFHVKPVVSCRGKTLNNIRVHVIEEVGTAYQIRKSRKRAELKISQNGSWLQGTRHALET